jgi:hypothetical protein
MHVSRVLMCLAEEARALPPRGGRSLNRNHIFECLGSSNVCCYYRTSQLRPKYVKLGTHSDVYKTSWRWSRSSPALGDVSDRVNGAKWLCGLRLFLHCICMNMRTRNLPRTFLSARWS